MVFPPPRSTELGRALWYIPSNIPESIQSELSVEAKKNDDVNELLNMLFLYDELPSHEVCWRFFLRFLLYANRHMCNEFAADLNEYLLNQKSIDFLKFTERKEIIFKCIYLNIEDRIRSNIEDRRLRSYLSGDLRNIIKFDILPQIEKVELERFKIQIDALREDIAFAEKGHKEIREDIASIKKEHKENIVFLEKGYKEIREDIASYKKQRDENIASLKESIVSIKEENKRTDRSEITSKKEKNKHALDPLKEQSVHDNSDSKLSERPVFTLRKPKGKDKTHPIPLEAVNVTDKKVEDIKTKVLDNPEQANENIPNKNKITSVSPLNRRTCTKKKVLIYAGAFLTISTIYLICKQKMKYPEMMDSCYLINYFFNERV